jgi:hypothetical protein
MGKLEEKQKKEREKEFALKNNFRINPKILKNQV